MKRKDLQSSSFFKAIRRKVCVAESDERSKIEKDKIPLLEEEPREGQAGHSEPSFTYLSHIGRKPRHVVSHIIPRPLGKDVVHQGALPPVKLYSRPPARKNPQNKTTSPSSSRRSREKEKYREFPDSVYISQKTFISTDLPPGIQFVKNKSQVILHTSHSRAPNPRIVKRRANRTQSEQHWRPAINVTRNNTFAMPACPLEKEELEDLLHTRPRDKARSSLSRTSQKVRDRIKPVHNNFFGGDISDINTYPSFSTMEHAQTPLNSPQHSPNANSSRGARASHSTHQGGYSRTLSSSLRDPFSPRQTMLINKVSIGEEPMHYMLQSRTGSIYNRSSRLMDQDTTTMTGEENQSNASQSRSGKLVSNIYLPMKPPSMPVQHWLQNSQQGATKWGGPGDDPSQWHQVVGDDQGIHEEMILQDANKFALDNHDQGSDAEQMWSEKWETMFPSDSENDSAAGVSVEQIGHLLEDFHLGATSDRSPGSDRTEACIRPSIPTEATSDQDINSYKQYPEVNTTLIEAESRSSTPTRLDLHEVDQGIHHSHSDTSSLSSLFSREYDDIGSLPCSPFYRRGIVHRRSSSIDSAMSRPSSDLLDVPFYVASAKDRLPGCGDSPASGDSPIASPVSVLSEDLQQQIVHRVNNPFHLPVTPCHSPEQSPSTAGSVPQVAMVSTSAAEGIPSASAPAVSLTTDDGDDFAVWFGRRGSIFIEDKGGQQPLLPQTTTGEDGKVSLAVPRTGT